MPSADTCEFAANDLSGGFSEIDFERFKTVIVAVSGGSDSTALLLLAKAYLARFHETKSLIAVTVDHGLRPGSQKEAGQVATLCAEHGVAHKTVKWVGDKPKTAIQQKAREARYDLLGSIARAHEKALVLTGHTFDDDLETRIMRGKRFGAVDADKGIAPYTLLNNEVWFARPLLEQRRSHLRVYLTTNDIPWIDDPSNDNLAFERIAVRKALTSGAYRSTGLLDDNSDNGAIADLLGDEQAFEFEPDGATVTIDLRALNRPYFFDVLRILLAFVGRTAYRPSLRLVEAGIRSVFAGPNKSAFTVNGCLVIKEDGAVHIIREHRNSGDGTFGFERILPSHDFEAAQMLRKRLNRPELPPVPRKLATC